MNAIFVFRDKTKRWLNFIWAAELKRDKLHRQFRKVEPILDKRDKSLTVGVDRSDQTQDCQKYDGATKASNAIASNVTKIDLLYYSS